MLQQFLRMSLTPGKVRIMSHENHSTVEIISNTIEEVTVTINQHQQNIPLKKTNQ